jgi:hypothetical protein
MKQLIKKILKEESLKNDLITQIKNDGWRDVADLVGGIFNLLTLLNITEPSEFLEYFNDLDVVQSQENPDLILFRYKEGKNLMVYVRKLNKVYISYLDIWSFLSIFFGYEIDEIEKTLKKWLSETFNITDVEVEDNLFLSKNQ